MAKVIEIHSNQDNAYQLGYNDGLWGRTGTFGEMIAYGAEDGVDVEAYTMGFKDGEGDTFAAIQIDQGFDRSL